MIKIVMSLLMELFVNSIESILFLVLISCKLKAKIKKPYFFPISFLFFTGVICLSNFMRIPSTISYLCLFSIHILYTSCFFQNPLSEKIYWGGIFTFIMLFSDKFTFWLVSLLTSYHANEFLIGGDARIYIITVYLLSCFALVMIFKNVATISFYLPKRFQLILILLTTLSIIISNSLLGLILEIDAEIIPSELSPTLNRINYLFLFIFFSLLLMIKWIGSVYKKNLELLEENQQTTVEKQQFELFAETTQALREWKHDYKNTLAVLNMMLMDEQPNKAQKYLNELLATEPAPAFRISSGNSVLDAIVSTKLATAKKLGIDFKHAIFLPASIPFSPLDFSTVMGNLLDNAIKACEDVLSDATTHSKPYIKVEIKPQMDMLYIRISNSSCGKYQYDANGDLISTKKEPGHGIGVKRILKIVHKYDGIYQQEPGIDRFTLIIMIPLPKNEELNQ